MCELVANTESSDRAVLLLTEVSSAFIGDFILSTIQVCGSEFIWPLVITLKFYLKLGSILEI